MDYSDYLRHSFANHLMQDGVNIRVLQKLLGHTSSKTTEIYRHVLSINNKIVQSPLDNMDLNIKFDHKNYLVDPITGIDKWDIGGTVVDILVLL